MKKTGIWLDKDKAIIVTIEHENESLEQVPSNIEHFHIHGGSGTRFKGGPQDVVQDKKYLEREKNQIKAYFKTIVSKVNDTDALVIFGPAEMNEKLNKELKDNFKDLGAKVKDVKKVDSMTDNQIKAWVRDFFRSA
ncbi:MAG: hypothetical protein ED556_00760 [Winogradskyella sp.]|uniref:hypothetical protein n=1 Tax=Winogradskyella sp. TaxID=1883156 RepID=UPI000F41D9E4|nr:hypothetical protein [Winogradskyella sp.]RNC87752.1 MAG: hypothetical protein ED556_00760 [Winogradskyella sp.]